MSHKIAIIAGESSGDSLGGQLVQAMRSQKPNTEFYGVGGEHMAKAGVNLLFSSDVLAVMGVIEIVSKLGQLRAAMKQILQSFKTNPPDLLILIDFPGFNLRLATRAKKMGIRVFYYVSPQIWAWHYSRIHRIRRDIDHMAVLFPFEKTLYDRENIPASFVGHPMTTRVQPTQSLSAILNQYNLDPAQAIIGLVPGSRHHEIERLLPIMLECVAQLRKTQPNLQVILPVANSVNPDIFNAYDLNGIQLIFADTYNALSVCHAVIASSGTVTLEIALLGIPLVAIYRVNALTAMIGRCFGGLRAMEAGKKSFALCNIVAERPLVPEYLQNALHVDRVTAHLETWINNPTIRDALSQELRALHDKLAIRDPAGTVAAAAWSLCE